MMGHSSRTAFGLAALTAILVATAAPAHGATADEPSDRQTWAVVPASPEGPDGRGAIETVVQPGDDVVEHVAVRNFGDGPILVELSALDAAQSADGAFDLVDAEEPSIRVGRWTTLSTAELEVPARSTIVIPVAITIPDDAEPGDHAGGVVATVRVDSADGSSTLYQVGTRVYLRVAGPVSPAVEFSPITGEHRTPLSPVGRGPLDVATTTVNTGNVRVAPAATVHVRSLFDWWTTREPIELPVEILPGAAVSVPLTIDDVPPLGPYWVSVELTSVESNGQDVTQLAEWRSDTVVVWAVPWVLLIAIALLLVAAIVAIVNVRRRRRARASEAATTLDE